MRVEIKTYLKKFLSRSPEETKELGRNLAALLRPGAVLALYGDLGAGKTCLAQGVARGLGVKDRYISSPSFVLVRQYRGTVPFYHIDLYRLQPGREVAGLGLEEYLEGEGVSAIEWAERAEAILPPTALRITIEFIDKTSRRFLIEWYKRERLDGLVLGRDGEGRRP